MLSLKDKKGVAGLDIAKSFILVLMTIAIIGFVTIVILGALGSSNAVSQSTPAYNQTQGVIGNVTGGVSSFFSNTGVWFSLLSVVIIILIVAIVIFAVNRFGGSSGGQL